MLFKGVCKLLFAVALILPFTLAAQENSGIAHSNYAPANTLFLNPSSIVDSKTYLDINILGTSAYLYSGPVFMPGGKFNVSQLLGRGNDDLPEPDYLNGSRNNRAYSDIMVHGPSFTLAMGRNSIGVQTGARMLTDLHDLPNQVVNLMLHGLGYAPQLNERYNYSNFQGNGLAYGQFGLSFGRMIKRSGKNILNVGATVKYLKALGHAGVNVEDIDFKTRSSGNILDLNSVHGSYAFSDFGGAKGSGVGFDLGLTYERKKEDVDGYEPHNKEADCVYADYRFKAGLSLLDIGSVKFQNATMRTVTGNHITIDTDTLSSEDIETFDRGLFDELEDNGATIAPRSTYSVLLPTALSLQFDYNFGKNIYLGGHYIKGLSRDGKFGVQRASSMALVPRYETKMFEVAMPISLEHSEQLSMGLACRVGPVIVGTDRLGPWLFSPNVNGMDFYVSAKLPIFKRKACRNTFGRNVYKRRVPRINNARPCPSFR